MKRSQVLTSWLTFYKKRNLVIITIYLVFTSLHKLYQLGDNFYNIQFSVKTMISSNGCEFRSVSW